MKKTLAIITAAGLLTVGGGSAAWAADTGPSTGDGAGESSSASPSKARHKGREAHRRALRRGAGKVVATTIGIEPRDLATQLRDGKSIAEVAQANNVEPQAVVDALVQAGNERIDKAVANDRIDAERASELKTKLAEKSEKLVERKRQPGEHAGANRVRRATARRAGNVAATTIGIEPRDLATQLRDGKSIAEVAQANNVEPQAVVDALVQAGNERIDKAVANDRIDAERASELKTKLAEKSEKLVEWKRP